MDADEESTILLSTGCLPKTVATLLAFAERYRQGMSADNVLKNRKLGTRSLVRIAKRLAMFPGDDLYSIITRSLLAEFLPAVERINLSTLLDDSGIGNLVPLVTLCSELNTLWAADGTCSSIQIQIFRAMLLSSLNLVAVAGRRIQL